MKYYLIGYPLGYSCSPSIHKAFSWFIKYEQKILEEKDFDEFMTSKNFKGLNITIPYKEKVIPYLDEIEENAKAIGAVNTIVNRNGKLIGYNTDFFGVTSAFEMNNVDIKDKVVMILGSGGTYKTCKRVCEVWGAKKIIGVSRNPQGDFISYQEAILQKDVEILINATPVGTYPNVEGCPINLDSFDKLVCVLDMIYNPYQTELLYQAKLKSLKTINGLLPLVYQAGKSEELFHQREINQEKYQLIYRKFIRNNTNIVLVGMPGAGKTKVGKNLASRLGYTFIDTDQIIEKEQKLSISEIFAKYGESYFRQLELDLIKRISLNKKMIISTGGGMIENEEIMRLLKYNGRIIFLKRKIKNNLFDGRRPKLKTKEDYYKLKERRKPFYYKHQDFIIDNNNSVNKTIERILKLYEDFSA